MSPGEIAVIALLVAVLIGLAYLQARAHRRGGWRRFGIVVAAEVGGFGALSAYFLHRHQAVMTAPGPRRPLTGFGEMALASLSIGIAVAVAIAAVVIGIWKLGSVPPAP